MQENQYLEKGNSEMAAEKSQKWRQILKLLFMAHQDCFKVVM
jgi:hypothetical protein